MAVPVIFFGNMFAQIMMDNYRTTRYFDVRSLSDIKERLGRNAWISSNFTVPFYIEDDKIISYMIEYSLLAQGMPSRVGAGDGFSIVLNPRNTQLQNYEKIELRASVIYRQSPQPYEWRQYFNQPQFNEVVNFMILPDTLASYNNIDFTYSLFRLTNTELDRLFDIPFRVFFAFIEREDIGYSITIVINENSEMDMDELLNLCFSITAKHFERWLF